MNLPEFGNMIFFAATRNKIIIYRCFLTVYAAILGFLILGAWAIGSQTSSEGLFYNFGIWMGRGALSLILIVLVPGMLGRFGIQIKVTRVITFYRRQLGITTFLLALTHATLVRLIYRLSGVFPLLSQWFIFEILGLVAIAILSFMFFTSNDYSVRRLGRWWKRLHRLVYVVIWLLLFHTALQRISIWSILAGIWAILEVISFGVVWIRRK